MVTIMREGGGKKQKQNRPVFKYFSVNCTFFTFWKGFKRNIRSDTFYNMVANLVWILLWSTFLNIATQIFSPSPNFWQYTWFEPFHAALLLWTCADILNDMSEYSMFNFKHFLLFHEFYSSCVTFFSLCWIS